MKKVLTLTILLCSSLTLLGTEVAKNSDTGMILEEIDGIYHLSNNFGSVVIGDINKSREFLVSVNACFLKDDISEYIYLGENKYKVEHDTEPYITQVGILSVKIRPSDAAKFLTVLETKVVKDKAGRIWNIIKE